MRRGLLACGGLTALPLTLMSLMPAGSARAQTADGSAGLVVTARGVVVDGLTGKPIARALVRTGDRRAGTLTASDGTFSIEFQTLPQAVQPGIFFFVEKPGYNDIDPPALIALDTRLSNRTLQFRLMPAAAISGQVSGAGAEPADRVRVTLLEDQVQEGRRGWRNVRTEFTTSDGGFRFGNLRTGEYTVFTGEWNDGGPLPQMAVTQEYPPDYLGDARESGGATRLHLHYGDSQEVQLHLQATNYYPVRIPVTTVSGSSQIGVRVAGPDGMNGFSLAYNRRDSAVEGSLPSGDYTLSLSSSGEVQEFARQPIHIENGPYQSAGVTLGPVSPIAVRVGSELTHQDGPAGISAVFSGQTGRVLPPVQLYLRSTEEPGSTRTAERTEQGVLQFANLPPGTYWAQASSYQGYVASFSSGGVDLTRSPLVVGAGGTPPPIDVTLRDDFATVTGTVQTGAVQTGTGQTGSEQGVGDVPTSGTVFLLFVPMDGSLNFVSSGVGNDLKFNMVRIAPGSYRVFAVRGNLPQIAWRDEKVVQALAGKGTTLSVRAGDNAELDVPLMDATELEGIQP